MTTPLRQCNLGVFYKDAKRYDKALDWYHRGARQGCPTCEHNIGHIYSDGHGVEQNIDTALEWYTKSAEKGHASAQNNVGGVHRKKGQHEEAFKWFMKAANQGDIYAGYNLGICYENGNGVKRNVPEAVKWFTKAAEKGHPRAAENARRLIDAMA